MSSEGWRHWAMTKPGVLDELARRVKVEVKRMPNHTVGFHIGSLEIATRQNRFELRRLEEVDRGGKRLIVQGELNTNTWNGWGTEEDALYALGVLRQRQVLDDVANV